MSFHVPEDRELLALVGEVTLRHSQLDHILKMTIKTLTRVSVDEAVDATADDGSATLRERIKKLARKELGEGAPLVRLQALLRRCKDVTGRRNALTHEIWAKELDGDAMVQGSDKRWKKPPTLEDLRVLAADIAAVTTELNEARLEGFLSQALFEQWQKKAPPA